MPRPRLILDLVIAIVASLFAAGLVLCMAFMLLGSHGLSLHLGYGVILGGVMLCSLLMGPRDRGGMMITAGLALVWILGATSLYVVRDNIHFRPHDHQKPAAALFNRERPE